jgi:hypothetical protein
MRKLFSLASIIPKRLGPPGRSAVANVVSQRPDRLARALGPYWVLLFLALTCYMALTQAVKSWLPKKAWA